MLEELRTVTEVRIQFNKHHQQLELLEIIIQCKESKNQCFKEIKLNKVVMF